jgi:recombination protein RecA
MAKKKQEESSENKTKLQLSLEKLEKAYGKGTVLALDSKVNGEYDVISTGSIGFDWITLGVGGFAKGKLYELMGWEGTGKSTICGHAVAECQKKGGVVLYIDGEHAVDKNYFQALGVDTTKMLIAQPSYGEEGFSIAMETIKSGEVDLIIIDSDSALIPKCVIEGEVGDASIGKKAKLNNDAYPKLKSALVENKVCLIVISQYREKIGVLYGNPTCTQGGHTLKFYTDCRIEISKSLAKEGEVTYGNLTKIKSTKNKISPPYRNCSFDIVYGIGIDKISEIVELGLEYGIIEKNGPWLSFDGSNIASGKNNTKKMLEDNPDLFEDIKTMLIRKIKNTDIPVEVEEEVNEF